MGTRYRLPAKLGGHEVEVLAKLGEDWRVRYHDKDESFPMVLPATVLDEVNPPLPTEPPVGSVVNCDAGYIHIRQSGRGWTGHDGDFTSWPRICSDCRGAVLLVRDPLADAPELPWTAHNSSARVDAVDNLVIDGTDRMVASVARKKARALWAAAQRAEEWQPPDWERELLDSTPAGRPRSCPTCFSLGAPRRDRGVLCPDPWHGNPTTCEGGC